MELEKHEKNPICPKCLAGLFKEPFYTYHGDGHNGRAGTICPEAEHIHLSCQRCRYGWLMESANLAINAIGTGGKIIRGTGRLLVPGMPASGENTERFEEVCTCGSRKYGWRKPGIPPDDGSPLEVQHKLNDGIPPEEK